jgi:hypothetical protein
MRNPYLLGAIETSSNCYTNIVNVEKGLQYKCIACQSDLLLRKGEKCFQSLIHKEKNNCQYFKNPTQEQLMEDARLHLSRLIEIDNVDVFRRCNICKIPCKMPITSIDNFKLYLKKNVAEYHNLENYKYYYTNIDQLNKYIRIDFATKKVELSCDYLTRCQECQINYPNN